MRATGFLCEHQPTGLFISSFHISHCAILASEHGLSYGSVPMGQFLHGTSSSTTYTTSSLTQLQNNLYIQVTLPPSLRLEHLPTSFKLLEGGLQTPSTATYERVPFFLNPFSQNMHPVMLSVSPDIFTHFCTIPSRFITFISPKPSL